MVAWYDDFVLEIKFVEKGKEFLEVLIFALVCKVAWNKLKQLPAWMKISPLRANIWFIDL